jgi:hypothetical protein
MGLRRWIAEHQQDERERYYVARAGMFAYCAILLMCLIYSGVYLFQDRVQEATAFIAIMAVGQIVWFGLLIRYRALRK